MAVAEILLPLFSGSCITLMVNLASFFLGHFYFPAIQRVQTLLRVNLQIPTLRIMAFF